MATDSGGGVITQRDTNGDLCELNMDSAPVLQHDDCIIGNGSLNETFGEYSPQNSDFVRVFTEVGTPSQQKVNNVTNNGHEDDEFSCSQPSQESVYVPQQEFIAKLDYDLADLPKETYISKLIEKTNNSDDCLTWYRSTLAGRAKSIQGCPTGKLYNRKSTTKSTSTSKYARDCYIIYMFLQGDKTQIDEVFRKDDNKLSVVEHNNEVVSNEIIEMRANIHILLERVSELEKSDQKNEKVIKILQTENNKLRSQYLDLNEQLVTHLRDYERKSTQNDAKFKVLSQSTKTLDDFDLNNFQQDIKTMNIELDRHNKLQSVMQKSLNELKLIVKPSYASITSSSRASGELNVSTSLHSTDTKKSQINEHLNVQTTPGNSNGTNVTLKESDHLSSQVDHSKHFVSNPELDHLKETAKVPNKDHLNFKIPVRVQEEITETNSDRIVGVELKNKSFGSIFIFGVYLPADGSIDNYRQELNALDDLYTYYINYGKVVVAGDFNASCINKNLQFTNTTKSKELQNFVHRHNICHPFIDTCKILPKGPEFTFTLKNTMLDYILIDETLVRQLRRYEILEEGMFSSTSDHLPVIACVELDENPHVDLNNFSKLPAWHKINEHSIKEYQDKLCAPLDILIQEAQNNDIDINLFYHNLVNTLINTAKDTIPCNMYNPHTKPYWNADVKQAHTKERNMRRVWMQEGRPRGMQHESYFNYKRAKRDFRNIQKLANEQYIEETYDDINNAAECDIRLFWKLIKRQKPKHSKVCQQIKHNNIVHTSPESICNAFANYFEDLYTPADSPTFDDPTLNEMNKAYREIERVCKADEDLYLPGGIISCNDRNSKFLVTGRKDWLFPCLKEAISLN
ncbi:unnamed protein product [Mytilus edulis]|uniref:Endonuclease/exonuclease/phosphatase domain-containing protein n=1 Tax=Mytilus edulis TaxID=6550 RepID=A0A8S3UPI9_MYTED|nr:unnamed protein product [Mytilus edulis]